MKTPPSVVMLPANNDIVELLAHGGLYWVTRKRFKEIETVSRMLGAQNVSHRTTTWRRKVISANAVLALCPQLMTVSGALIPARQALNWVLLA